MTERPSQNKQILDKVNESLVEVKAISTIVNDLSVEVGKITKELELRPSMDKSEHDGIKNELTHHKEEIDALKANQRLIVVAIILAVVAAVMKIIVI